jgi:hypothetical protein
MAWMHCAAFLQHSFWMDKKALWAANFCGSLGAIFLSHAGQMLPRTKDAHIASMKNLS